MKRTISIKLKPSKEAAYQLATLRDSYHAVCNALVPIVREHRCWNRVALHNLSYTEIRAKFPLGSQMVCNAIFSVCKAYLAKPLAKDEAVPMIQFRPGRSVHFDKRTYSIKGDALSLYTLEGRVRVPMILGAFQQSLFSQGAPREAELVCKKGDWYFHLVLEFPEAALLQGDKKLGVDIGENVLAATSSGKLFGGGESRHERDKFLDKRRQLQSNGSESAKQLLKKISGKEARRLKQMNHTVSKKIVKEAIEHQCNAIVMEDLTHIRKRIKGGTRMKSRLHRWPFRQLQIMIQYKAESIGLQVIYVNPAYSSQTCSQCGQIGVRERHHFKCSCGNQQHSDLNASRTLCRFAPPIGGVTCAVNRTYVAASC